MTDHPSPEGWQDEVRGLLSFLPELYPGSGAWLDRRLELVADGKAFSHQVRTADGRLAGIVLGIPKDSRRFKISTLYVAKDHRGSGIGGVLIDAALLEAQSSDCSEIYITGASSVRDQLFPLLASRGFELISTAANRYGPGRDEDVYSREV